MTAVKHAAVSIRVSELCEEGSTPGAGLASTHRGVGDGKEVVPRTSREKTSYAAFFAHLNSNMKKTSRKGAFAMKGGVAPKTVDQYLADIPEPAQSTLKHVRAMIRSVVPEETTEVISYGIPMFKFNGMLVGYAAFKNHCSLFPTGSGVMDRFEKELKGFPYFQGNDSVPVR